MSETGKLVSENAEQQEEFYEVNLILTGEALAALRDALELHGRVAMGQWSAIVEHAPAVLPPSQSWPFSEAADALMEVRCQYASHEALRESHGSSVSIARAGRQAQIVCDLWRSVGGGMPDRADMRLTDTVKDSRVFPVEVFDDDEEISEIRLEEVKAAMRKALAWAGLSLEQLEKQANAGVFETDEAEIVWFRIGDFVKEGVRP